MLPVLPGPVLLAETDAPFEIATDCPAVRAMLPPAPDPGSLPIERLNTPAGVPSLRVPEKEIELVEATRMLPPAPVLVVPLSMRPPC